MPSLPGTTNRRRIHLMRHGRVDYFGKQVRRERRTDLVPLTPLGREQASGSGAALAHVRFDHALCSALPRTRETAQRVLAANADVAHLTIEAHHGLEEIKGGVQTAKSRAELSARLTSEFDQAAKPGATIFGGEVSTELLDRSSQAVKRLLALPDWHTALVVAHEGINRSLLGWMTGNGLNAIQSFEQDLACVNILDFDLVPGADGTPGAIFARQ